MLFPLQIVPSVADAVTAGGGPTVTVTVFVPEHPFVVPVTVYVIVLAGETVMLLPVRLPGIQV